MVMGLAVGIGFVGLCSIVAIASGILELRTLSKVKEKGAEAVAVCRGHTWGRAGKNFYLDFPDASGTRHTFWTSERCVEGRRYKVRYNPARPRSVAFAPVRVWDLSRPRQIGLLAGFAGLVVLALIIWAPGVSEKPGDDRPGCTGRLT